MIHFSCSFIWIAIMILSIVLEVITLGISAVWIFFGSLAAYISYKMGLSIDYQVAVLIAVSLVMDYSLRPLVLKILCIGKSRKYLKDCIGKKVRIISAVCINESDYKVLLDNMEWRAKPASSDYIFHKNDYANIIRTEGSIAVIEPTRSIL